MRKEIKMEIDYESGTAHLFSCELLDEDNINALNAFFDANNVPPHYTLKDEVVYLKEGIYPFRNLKFVIINNMIILIKF